PFANSVKGVEYRAWAEEFLRCSFVTLTVLHKPYFLLRNPDFLAKVLIERMSWGRWKALHPNTQVLASNATEFANYPSLTPSNSKNRSPITVSTLLIIALTACAGLLTLLSIQRRREERRG
ncbi:MAG: hypothetical protein NT023_17120, partial [Armatimonadetes bacterium]|nr:hypothetical protein [Armatimonadota bacterium]